MCEPAQCMMIDTQKCINFECENETNNNTNIDQYRQRPRYDNDVVVVDDDDDDYDDDAYKTFSRK